MVISAKTFTEIQAFVGEMVVHKFKTQKESLISLVILSYYFFFIRLQLAFILFLVYFIFSLFNLYFLYLNLIYF